MLMLGVLFSMGALVVGCKPPATLPARSIKFEKIERDPTLNKTLPPAVFFYGEDVTPEHADQLNKQSDWAKQHVGPASGLVEVPSGTKVFMGINARPREQALACLKALKAGDVQNITLATSFVFDKDLQLLGNLDGLEILDLSQERPNWERHDCMFLTDEAIPHIRPLKTLQSLHLDGSLITDACITNLGLMTGLRMLSVGNTLMTPEGIQQLQRELPKCKIKYEPLSKEDQRTAWLEMMAVRTSLAYNNPTEEELMKKGYSRDDLNAARKRLPGAFVIYAKEVNPDYY